MVLYHFCSADNVSKIKKQGLVRGNVVIKNGERALMLNNLQWLTDEPRVEEQAWASMFGGRRVNAEFRLTVEVSEPCMHNLMTAADFVARLPAENAPMLHDKRGHEHWYVYLGQVPNFWITKVEDMRNVQ